MDLLGRRYRDSIDRDAHEFMNHIEAGTAKMQQMIKDLLAYARVNTVEAGDAPETSANAALQEALWKLQSTIQQAGAIVTHDALPEVRYTPAMLAQLFQNLIENAIKYRREEAPRVYVFAERRELEWVFAVRDNGSGFPPEQAERIFEVLRRLHGPEIPGTGIGLAVCRRIVERHGGTMWATSEPGAGSTFFFTVPV